MTSDAIRRAAVNLVDTLVLERETSGQSQEFMDWAYFMTARAFETVIKSNQEYSEFTRLMNVGREGE